MNLHRVGAAIIAAWLASVGCSARVAPAASVPSDIGSPSRDRPAISVLHDAPVGSAAYREAESTVFSELMDPDLAEDARARLLLLLPPWQEGARPRLELVRAALGHRVRSTEKLYACVRLLEHEPESEAGTLLVELVRDRTYEPGLNWLAFRALRDRDEVPLDLALELLFRAELDGEISRTARSALVQIGAQAREVLHAAVRSDPGVWERFPRAFAASEVRAAADARVDGELVRRLEALDALGRFGSPVSVPVLEEAASEGPLPVRLAAVSALLRVRPLPESAMERLPAVWAELGGLRDRRLERIIALAATTGDARVVRLSALEAERGGRARSAAVRAWALLGTAAELTALPEDPVWRLPTRWKALASTCTTGECWAALLSSPDPVVFEKAAGMVLRLNHREVASLPAVWRALGAERTTSRRWAIRLLDRFGPATVAHAERLRRIQGQLRTVGEGRSAWHETESELTELVARAELRAADALDERGP